MREAGGPKLTEGLQAAHRSFTRSRNAQTTTTDHPRRRRHSMRTRRSLVAMLATALLALAGTAAAVAENSPSPASPPARDAGARQGPRCDRVEHVIANLERFQTRLEARIARVQERIASGNLSEKRLAHAERVLARLQHRLEKLETFIARLESKLAEKCSGDD
jgi:hypothetical protein